MSIVMNGNPEIDKDTINRMKHNTLTPDYLTGDVLQNLSREVLRSLLKYFSPCEHPKTFAEIIVMLDIRNQRALGGQKGAQQKMKDEIAVEVFNNLCKVLEYLEMDEDQRRQLDKKRAGVDDTDADDQAIDVRSAAIKLEEIALRQTEESDANDPVLVEDDVLS